ncbi:MAG: phospholipase A2 [Candidatus Omnitrophica bacterium]|nr:phospholipase A2 [Candidatus Omnitrophota bacterium]MCM8802281.1 phospholipase A2 [Candidatus Omnitrophota bacterium]
MEIVDNRKKRFQMRSLIYFPLAIFFILVSNQIFAAIPVSISGPTELCANRPATYNAISPCSEYIDRYKWKFQQGSTVIEKSGNPVTINFLSWGWWNVYVTVYSSNPPDSGSASILVNVTYHELANWDEYEACKDKMQHPTKAKVTDGCTFSPDQPCPGVDFFPCCRQHDFCYQTCNANKSDCDWNFYNCMMDICDNIENPLHRICCVLAAGAYYNFVNVFGIWAYRHDQVLYCVCCD